MVDPVVVVFPPCDFRADVIRGAAIGLPDTVAVHGPAEVRHLDLVISTEQNVFRLDIPVYDFQAVQIHECKYDLLNVYSYLFLRELLHLPEDLIELTVGGILENIVDALLVEKEAVHAQDVRVDEMGVNLYLATDLVDDVVVYKLLL